MASNNHANNANGEGMGLHQLRHAAANQYGAINHLTNNGAAANHSGGGHGAYNNASGVVQHQSSAGLGVQNQVPDSQELLRIANMLQVHNTRLDGLDKLTTALARTPARKLLCDPQGGGSQNLLSMFKGLRLCLQVDETQTDALLRVNQILYDMMQDLPRSPNELMPEVTALIPYFIENLGNSKATVRKSTHKCIGTYVKFSKRLEFVLQNIIKYGLENNNQRTRQHSMLVIPALISLKAAVIQGQTPEMRQLIEAVISRLRDPADQVAKTAKKLLLELQKCYPTVFKQNYIDSLPNEDERTICNLILENKFDEATKLIMSTSPSKRMAQGNNISGGQAAVQPSPQFNPPMGINDSSSMSMMHQSTLSPNQTRNDIPERQQTMPSHNFGAIGKAIVPTGSNQPQSALMQSPNFQTSVSTDQRVDHHTMVPPSTNNSFIISDRQQQQQRALQDSNSMASPGTLGTNNGTYKSTQQAPAQQNLQLNVSKHGDLSVVGREIMSSQVPKAPIKQSPGLPPRQDSALKEAPQAEDYQQQFSSKTSMKRVAAPTKQLKSQTQGGLPIDQNNGLVFGFLEEELVEALNENNQWKDRTNAMEKIEAQLMQLIGTQQMKHRLTEQTATAFLGFIYQFITDINFKISLASIKIVTLLLQEDLINLKVYFNSLLSNLIEKLSDSKQVVRDMVMDCCCNLINRSKPVPFANQVIKYLQHANWHVREGVLILLVRCVLVTTALEGRKGSALKPSMPGDSGSSSLGQICTNAQLIEEVCFLVKVEDKKQLQQMGVDTLALIIGKSPQKSRTEGLVTKELGVQSSDSQMQAQQFGGVTTKDNQIYAQIQQRILAQAFPFLNTSDQVEFAQQTAQPMATSVSTPTGSSVAPSAQFLQHKQQTQDALSEGGAPGMSSEIQQISNSLQQMQINSNFGGGGSAQGGNSGAKGSGPSAKMMQGNQPGLLGHQGNAGAFKTPSMAFLESKRREEEKQLQSQQQYPQSADFKKVAGAPMSPISAPQTSTLAHGNSLPGAQGGQTNSNVNPSSYSMRKLTQQKKGGPASASATDENGEKIAMWLPSFSPMPEAASSQQPSAATRKQDMMMQSPVITSSKDPRLQSMQMSQEFSNASSQAVQISPHGLPRSTKAPEYNGYHLNATASSSATFIAEDNNRNSLVNRVGLDKAGRAPSGYTDQANKTQSDMQHQGHPQGQVQNQQRSGYIPEVHTGKPRSIQSNYDKQRAFNQSQGSNNSSNQSSTGPSQQTIAGTTQPTNNSNGFDKSQISDRLQLLKNTNKYKTKVGEAGQQQILGQQDALLMHQQNYNHQAQGGDQYSDAGGSAMVSQQTMNYTVMPETDQQSTSHAHSMYANNNGGNMRHGPIRAAHLTINQEPKSQQNNVGNKKMSAGLPTHVQLKQRQSQQMQTVSSQSSQKPPTISQYSNFTGINEPRGAAHTHYDETSRASSIDYANHNKNTAQKGINPNERPIRPAQNRQQNMAGGMVSQSEKKPNGHSKLGGAEGDPRTLANLLKQDSAQVYEAKEEPLMNPESQLRPAIEALKSSDWSKTFEACNVIKRGVLFHKNLFAHPTPMTAQVFKDIVKAVDSLRSQVAKNACLTLSTMFSELAPRDVDTHIETVMPTVIKRSTDTNQFISQEAEKSLIAICNNCTETRVFAALQSQTVKSAAYKEKICLCYTVLIERLAHRLKNFRDLERLVQSVVRFLSEGAVEVRNQAKYAVLTLQSVCGTQRELDGILLKARLNENQMEKVRKVLASEDFESLSNYANTRYGASMRASPLGGARHTQYNAVGVAQPRHKVNGSYGASGSDGFQRNNLNNMQQTFLSSGAAHPKNPARGGSSGPVGTSGIGNAIPRGGVLSDHHITMQRGATSNHESSSGFDGTQNTFNKRTTSLSKPVDRNLIEEMRNLVDQCSTSDWQKRLRTIDQLEQFARAKGVTIRNSHASFINLMDAYCKLLNDNNTKVQTKTQQSFEALMTMQEMGALINSNLIMIVQALTQNLCATNSNVRQQGDRLFDFLEEVVITESRGNTNALLQPIVGCLSQPQNKVAKPQLVDRLSNLVERVDKQAIITRLLNPLVQPGHKLQQEGNGNVALKQALQRLAITIQSAELGLNGMGIGLK